MQHAEWGIPVSDVTFGNFLFNSCVDTFEITTPFNLPKSQDKIHSK